MSKDKKPFKETKLGKWLSEKAPKIGNAIGDVLPDKGGLGIIKRMISSDPDLTPEQKLEAEKLIQETELELAKLEAADRDSARKMQIEALHQDDVFSKRFIYYLSAFIVVSATAFGVMLFYVQVPEENRRMVEMFADVYLFAGALTVINFFFGSAFRSKQPQPKKPQA
jgi:hypothetical protein